MTTPNYVGGSEAMSSPYFLGKRRRVTNSTNPNLIAVEEPPNATTLKVNSTVLCDDGSNQSVLNSTSLTTETVISSNFNTEVGDISVHPAQNLTLNPGGNIDCLYNDIVNVQDLTCETLNYTTLSPAIEFPDPPAVIPAFPSSQALVISAGTSYISIPSPQPEGITIEVTGAGGGGGGPQATDAGGGGGGGEYFKLYIPKSKFASLGIPSSNASFFIRNGSGGTAGAFGVDGETGLSTEVRVGAPNGTILCSARGGRGGLHGNNGAFGGEGASSSGQIPINIIYESVPGKNGFSGKDNTGSQTDAYNNGGMGGSSFLGRGGLGAGYQQNARLFGQSSGPLLGGGGGGGMQWFSGTPSGNTNLAAAGAPGHVRINFY